MLDTLLRFLLGSLLGWWILFLLGATAAAGLASAWRGWRRRARWHAMNRIRLENPGNAEVRFEIATMHAEARRWRRAEEFAAEAAAIAKDNPSYGQVPHKFLRLRADALYGQGRWAEAAEAYRKSLEVRYDAGYDAALLGVARSEYRAGRPAEAFEFARHALDENSSLLEAWFRRAQAAAALGRDADVEEARQGFHRVAALLPPFGKHRRFRWKLAFAFFGLARRIA